MGAISSLNQTSQSFDYVQDLTGFDKSEEYALFSDYLSPLSHEPEPDVRPNASYQEKYDQPNQINDDRQRVPSIEEQSKDQKRNSAPEASSSSKTNKNQPLSKQSLAQKGDTHPTFLKNNASAPEVSQVTIASLPSADSKGAPLKGLNVLKENVKTILNNVKAVNNRTSTVLANAKTQAHPEKIPFYKISTEAPKSSQKLNFQQTTVAHLASRGRQEVIGSDHKPLPTGETQTTKQPAFLKLAKNQSLQPKTRELGDQDSEQLKDKKSKKRISKGADPYRSRQTTNQHTSNNEANTTGSIVKDQNASAQLSLKEATEQKGMKSGIQDAGSNDADFAHLLSKGQQNTDSIRGKRFKAQSTTRAYKALNWLKTLSDRTSLLDKTNPQWKVMEMQLEKGNGKMTVKVMKESDQVSVAVNFSDPDVRAMAEAEYTNILKNLQEQYQQEVRFTFSDHEQTPFESFNSQKAPSRRTSSNLTHKGLQVNEQNSPAGYHDQQGWIG